MSANSAKKAERRSNPLPFRGGVIEGVLERLLETIEVLPDRCPPNPSPEGEGRN
jgi:hypothetical protein